MKSAQISLFSGGMNEWLHPSLLDGKTAHNLIDGTVDNGKLKPIQSPRLLSIGSLEQYGHYGNRNRSLVKWYDRYYWSDNTALSAPYYGGDKENYLGIPFPTYGTSGEVQIEAYGAGEDEDGNELGLTGNYKFCVTYVNENGWEGAPGSLTDYEVNAEVENCFFKFTATWTDERISYAKCWRTIAEGSEFYCVGEIHESGGTFNDQTSDTEAMALEVLSSEDNYPPPDGGKYLCEYGGVFFLAVGSRLYFSVVGNPHAWPTLQFVGFDDTITGIVSEFQGVLVFTHNNAFRITGADDSETIVKTAIPGNHGCKSWRTISQVSNAPIWLSNDGICLWDGESVSIPSYQVMDTRNLQVRFAASSEDKYFLFLVNSCIVFDRRNGDIFYKLSFGAEYAWYDADTDIFYLVIQGQVYVYGNGDEMTYQYESGYIGDSELTYKKYYEVTVSNTDSSDLVVNVDGTEVVNTEIEAGRARLKLPFGTVGRYLTVGIKSKGELSEIGIVYE